MKKNLQATKDPAATATQESATQKANHPSAKRAKGPMDVGGGGSGGAAKGMAAVAVGGMVVGLAAAAATATSSPSEGRLLLLPKRLSQREHIVLRKPVEAALMRLQHGQKVVEHSHVPTDGVL